MSGHALHFLAAQSPRDVLVLHEALDVQRDRLCVRRHQLLEFLALGQQFDKRPRLGMGVHLVACLEVVGEVFGQQQIKVPAAEVSISSCGQYLRQR